MLWTMTDARVSPKLRLAKFYVRTDLVAFVVCILKELLPPPLPLCEKIREYPAVELWCTYFDGHPSLSPRGKQGCQVPLRPVVGVVVRCETGKLRGA
jgi:hypothetical protein